MGAVREIHVGIGTRRHDIEFGIVHIYAIDHAVQPRHAEGLIALVLAFAGLRAGNFLVGAGDDEIGLVHSDEIFRVLALEMLFVVVVLPVDVGIQVFVFFQRKRNIA